MDQIVHVAHPSKDAAEPLLTPPDPIWRQVRDDALEAIERDPDIEPLVADLVLSRGSLDEAIIAVLAYRLDDPHLPSHRLESIFGSLLDTDPGILRHRDADLRAVVERDPACNRFIEPLIFFKGFHALQAHRFAHNLWRAGRRDLALFIQSRMSARFQVDIHPGTRIGGGIFFDHATGIVIGETAVIADQVSIMQNVTLGGTGKESGDRHPKVHEGVLVGAGAKVLGNITLGRCARVAASSVVLDNVPAGATVAGIPARIVGSLPVGSGGCMPAESMDHTVPQERLVDEGSGI